MASTAAEGGGDGAGGGAGATESSHDGAVVPAALPESVVELCLNIGVKAENLASKASGVTNLECFQTYLVTSLDVQYFGNVKEICFVQVPRCGPMAGFEHCPVLERLWLPECRLERIEGLHANRRLRVLGLGGNKIKKIEGLDRLTALEELWLDDNKISLLEGLDNLCSLRLLSIARNQIERVGTALDHLDELEDLNMADNRVGYFKEIHNLTRLPKLKKLCFSDPHYGDNPVCNLCNYQTYVLYQLGQLEGLDTLLISEEAKQLAEATYIKKKMYYNMRIKTLKRNTTNVIKRAAEALQARAGQINLNFNVLLRQQKEVERELDEEREASGGDGAVGGRTSATTSMTDSFRSQLVHKRSVIKEAILRRSQEVVAIERRFSALKDRLQLISQQNIARMIVELGTGGNIRLEDGKPSDVWYSSCVELLHSRFFQRDFVPMGVTGVKVHRVTRVHNRFLRNRFDRRMSTILARNAAKDGVTTEATVIGKPPRRSLEYLFFTVPGSVMKSPTIAAAELQRIAQEGFSSDHTVTPVPLPPLPRHAFVRPPCSYAAGRKRFAKRVTELSQKRMEAQAKATAALASKTTSGIPLTNSLSCADMPRLTQCVASVLEGTGEWKPSRHSAAGGGAGSGAGAGSGSGGGGGGDSDASSVPHMSVIGAEERPSRWLHRAGVDLSSISTKLALQSLRSAEGKRGMPPAAAPSPTRSGTDGEAAGPSGPVWRLQNPEVSEGVVMIAKVFLGNCQLLDSTDGTPIDPATGKPQPPAGSAASVAATGATDNPDHKLRHSVCRARSDDPKQRTWVILEPSLVLPEYIIEFEYDWQKESADGSAAPAATMSSELSALAELSAGLKGGASGGSKNANIRLTPQAEADLRPLARPLASFVSDCRSAMQRTQGKEEVEGSASGSSTGGGAAGAGGGAGAGAGAGAGGASAADSFAMQALDMPPTLPARPKVSKITEEVVLGQIPGTSLQSIQYLNLHGNNIKVIEGLAACMNLRRLVLSFNEITVIEGLSALVNLETLELGFNLIKRIQGLRGLSRLRSLELNNNLLYQLEDVRELKRCVPDLTSLNLRNNGLCDVKSYRSVILAKLRKLKELDGRTVADADRRAVATAATSITLPLIKLHSRTSTGAALVTSAMEEEELLELTTGDSDSDDGASAAAAARGVFVDSSWCSQVETLNLAHMRLRKISMLDDLSSLRIADFADNELTVIEGLEKVHVLEELNLEENRIVRMEALSSLRFLKKLDLGKNRISKVEGISSLSQLSQLSLEDNELVSLEGLGRLPALMELYIGNNRIDNIKEVLSLKDLPKLIILDLSGNPLCRHEKYRLYTVYHLRRLKVLDGVGVDNTEQAAARDRFSGRLTAEFLEEKIGHTYFEAIRELDLAQCRIREIEGLSGDTFRCLSYLNLDHNQLTGSGLGGLTQLPHLSVLRLNHNRISSLLPECTAVEPIAPGSAVAKPSTEAAPGQPGGSVGSFARLEVLQLGFNQISDIAQLGLHRLPALKVLYLQGNDISRVTGLETCRSLRELVLDKNRIKYLDPTSFSGLTALRDLHMQENGLRSLSHLHYLVSVQVLALSFNRISDLPELDKLGCLPCLTELWLANNPVARKQLYRPGLLKRLPSLQFLDGREILMDERDRAEFLFSADPRPSPVYVQDTRQTTGKVPVRLTSVNFESLTGSEDHGRSAMSYGASAGGPGPQFGAPGAAQYTVAQGDARNWPGLQTMPYSSGAGGGAGASDMLMPLGRGPAPPRGSGRAGRDPSPLGYPTNGRMGGGSSRRAGRQGGSGSQRYGQRNTGGTSPRHYGRR